MRDLLELRAEFPGSKVLGRACDVSKSEDLEALAALAVAELAYIDIWINNAGMSQTPNVCSHC